MNAALLLLLLLLLYPLKLTSHLLLNREKSEKIKKRNRKHTDRKSIGK